jgi:4-carboxymuconolactone decarboxylase
MSRLTELRRDQLTPDALAVWDAVVGTRGSRLETPGGGLAGPFNAFLHAPAVGGTLAELGATLRYGTSVDRRLTEVAIITVGARWKAEFEWWAHARMAARHGVPDEVIDAIGHGGDPPFEADDERTVYLIARSLATQGSVPAADYERGRALLGETGIVELVTLCGYYTLISFLLNAFDVQLPEGAAPRWGPAPG